MATPTRSLRLIKRHIREQKISRTTLIVTAYLLTNILGRLSVSIFGLAFNLKDKERIEYPLLETNWTSALWARNIDPVAGVAGAPKGYEIVEGKDTTPLDSVLLQGLVLIWLKRIFEFSLEWIADLQQKPCARLGFWK